MDRPKGIKVIYFQTVLLLTLVATFFLASLFFYLYNRETEHNWEHFIGELIAVSQLTAEHINGDKHQQLVLQDGWDSYLYAELAIHLTSLQEYYPNIISVYTLVQTDQQDVWKVVLEDNQVNPTKEKLLFFENLLFPEFQLANQDTVVIPESTVPMRGVPSISYTPIRSSNGEVVAILSVEMDVDNLVAEEAVFLRSGLILLGIAILGVVVGSLLITGRLLKPVEVITNELEKIRPGEKLKRITEHFPGEWSILAKRFNQLLDENDAYHKRHEEIIVEAIEEKDKIFQIYRDVIYAVTQGKVFLVTEEEFFRQFNIKLPMLTLKLAHKQDITRCRREVDIFLQDNCNWWAGPRRKRVLLSLSEALTNVIKHAGSGEISIVLKDGQIIFYVLDQGTGMDLEKLPYMVFISGYTTKNSLGTGFSLMHYYMDRLIICTTDKGTYLALEANKSSFCCQAVAESQG